MINEISLNIAKSEKALDNRYFQSVENPKVVDIIFVTADKGLCGGFNSQTIKKVNELRDEYSQKGATVRLRAIGKKGIAYFKFNKIDMINQIEGLSSSPDYQESSKFIQECIDDYLNGKTDKVIIIHNGYVNMITQEIRVEHILPVDASEFTVESKSTSELELEPDDDDTLLEALVRRYLEYVMYYTLIDSLAGEHGARMQAMDTATNNANEMVKTLTVAYNKARQEAITTELIEIISGVESMK